MHRSIAPLSVLLLSCSLPFAASASTSTRELCRIAERDPAAFLQQPNFADNILRMSTNCPEIALALTDLATGTIAAAPNRDGNSKVRPGGQGPDYSDLLARLKVATKNLDTATTNVEKAQAALNRTVRNAKRSGMTEEELQALYALNGEDGHSKVLPDYTAAKRQALADYVAARDRLAAAEEKLDQANDRAKPLVQKALELAGRASVAQEDLSKVLDGLSREERQAILDKTLADAKQSIADLEARVADEAAKLAAVMKALDAAWDSPAFKKAQTIYDHEERKLAKATKAYQDRLADDPSCTGDACTRAKKKLDEAAEALDEAGRHFWKVKKELELPALIASYNETAAALAASQAAQALAEENVKEAARQAKELSDLLSAAAEALTQADAASQEARAATAEEEAEVAAARAALDVALAKAEAALEGSAEEQAALDAVHAAKADLRAALDALGAAQSVADELTTEVAEIQTPPEKVTEKAEELETASDEGEAAADAALDDLDNAEDEVNDYHDAEGDLRDALDADKPAEDTAGEASQDSNEEAPSEPNT